MCLSDFFLVVEECPNMYGCACECVFEVSDIAAWNCRSENKFYPYVRLVLMFLFVCGFWIFQIPQVIFCSRTCVIPFLNATTHLSPCSTFLLTARWYLLFLMFSFFFFSFCIFCVQFSEKKFSLAGSLDFYLFFSFVNIHSLHYWFI